MTIRIQPPNSADKLLALFGKKRAIFVPNDSIPFGYYIARRENVLRALFRRAGQPPPKGWCYWDDTDDNVEPCKEFDQKEENK